MPPTKKQDASALTPTLLIAVITASLGTWFTLGYNIVAMNGPQSVIINWIRSVECSRQNGSDLWCAEVAESDEPLLLAQNPKLSTLWAIASSISGFGGVTAILTCASLVNRYGPKKSLFFIAGVITLGVVIFSLSTVANSYEMLIIGRLVCGFSMGMICVCTPIYTSELSPVSLRGAMGTIPIVISVIGMAVSTILGSPLILGAGTDWTILVALQLIPVAIMCVVLCFCPESPAYLYLVRKEKNNAERVLIWLRRTTNVQKDLLALEAELVELKYRQIVSIIGIFRKPELRFPLAVCAVNMAAQHGAGYGCVTTYSTSIFTSIGLSVINSIYASVGLWLTYLVSSLASMLVIDRLGRRTLLLASHVGILLSFCIMVTCMALTRQGHTTAKFGSAASLFFYVAAYGVGLASIPYIITGELFAQDARAAAMTVACAVNWASVLVTTFVFSVVVPLAGEYTFICFIFFTLITGAFVYWKQPETRGQSIDDIQIMLRERGSFG